MKRFSSCCLIVVAVVFSASYFYSACASACASDKGAINSGETKIGLSLSGSGGGNRLGSDTTVKTQIPGSGDYDGNGKTDIAVYRPGDGRWYVVRSSDGEVTSTQQGLGALHDGPVSGNHNGEPKTDIAVWRPSVGMWYIVRSSDGGVTATPWGPGDRDDIPITESDLIYRYLEGSLF
jgi:hypothetical protein